MKPWIPRPSEWIPPALKRTLNELISGQKRWPLLIHGAVGRGKTTGALYAADHLAPCYFTTSELIEHQTAMMGSLRFGRPYEEDPWPMIGRVRFAVLDEIGIRGQTIDQEYGVITRFFDERLKMNRVAVYVTNHGPEQLGSIYDERILDRLTCGTLFEYKGESRR